MRPHLLFALPLAFALGAPVLAQSSPAPAPAAGGSTTTLQLQPENGSGETGTVTMTPAAGGIAVDVSTDKAPDSPQPAHIHKGTCAKLDPAPEYPLTNVTKSSDGAKGTSMTTVSGVTMAQLTSTPHAVNLHKSTSDIKDYVACVDIKPAGAMSK